MRFLHTSDWHVGKVLKGHDRIEEHRAVLGEIVQLAAAHAVDAVLVVGDLFETALPSPDAQKLVWDTLMALRQTEAEVIVVAGNHDNPNLLEAMVNVFSALNITVIGRPRRPDHGGVIRFTARSTGEPVEVAALPFVSQRGIVTSLHLMGEDMAAAQLSQTYATRVHKVISALTGEFSNEAIRIFACHAHVHGGKLGGGERDAQTIFDYGVEPSAFPSSAHYVALGHLHRGQRIPGPCPIHYCGSPVQVDFGEEADSKQVLLVEATLGRPAVVTPLPLATPRLLRTVEGTEAQLEAAQGFYGDSLLRIRVRDTKNSAGLAERVRGWHPNALEVRIDLDPRAGEHQPALRRDTRSPIALFGEFLEQESIADQRLTQLFAELLDESTAADAADFVNPVGSR